MLVKRRKRPRSAKRTLVEVSLVSSPLLVEPAFLENLTAKDMWVVTRGPWGLGSYVYLKSAAGEIKTKARVVSCTACDSGNFVLGLSVLSL